MKLSAVVAFGLLMGCTATQEKPAIDVALSNTALRAQTFEATARTLDEHPDYVDEFYQVARKHPQLMHRFLVNTSRDLREEELARPTAKLLAQNPDSLERILIDTTQESKRLPKSRLATARAVAAEHDAMSDAITDYPIALKTTMMASVEYALKKDQAREALLEAMRERAPELATMLLHDPGTLRMLLDAMLKQAGGDKTAMEALLRSLAAK